MIPAEIAEENLTIEVTTRCTSSCRHCFARAGRNNRPELSISDARAILSEGYTIGFRHLHLTGGEPLLWDGLYDLIREALGLGYENIFLNSNGHLIDTSAADTLAGFKDKLQVSISLQGPEEHHDSFRGTGSYRKAEAGITALLAAKVPLHIFTTVDRGLLPQLPRFVDTTCREFSEIASHTLIQLVRVHNDDLNLENDLLSPEEFITLVKTASLLRLPGYPIALLENPLATAAARLMDLQWLPPSKSLHRKGRMVILADGTMTPAHSTRDSFGTWEPGKLKSIMESHQYHDTLEKDTATCPGCEHRDICRDTGMDRPSEWFRDMDTQPFCRRVLDLIALNTSKE